MTVAHLSSRCVPPMQVLQSQLQHASEREMALQQQVRRGVAWGACLGRGAEPARLRCLLICTAAQCCQSSLLVSGHLLRIIWAGPKTPRGIRGIGQSSLPGPYTLTAGLAGWHLL